MLESERQGVGLYLGYQHQNWGEQYRTLLAAATHRDVSRTNQSHVLLVESHYGTVELEHVLPSLKQLSRTLTETRGASCPLVLMTRIREPLEFYLSFYRWAIGFRQRDNPKVYGATFLEWARRMPNLQSTILLQSMAAYSAEYAPRRYRERFVPRGAAVKAWRRLRDHLDQFDIVAPLGRFDEAMLMLHDKTGLPPLLYRRNRPGQKNGYRGTDADACPDMAACRTLIASIAERDHRMWLRYKRRFEARLAELGEPFARRVQRYKRAVAEVQPLWRRAPRQQVLCRFQPGTRAVSARPELQTIRCPLGAGAAAVGSRGASGTSTSVGASATPTGMVACASVYAHRLFECPWQYRPNATLTDALSCWRPSSGFK